MKAAPLYRWLMALYPRSSREKRKDFLRGYYTMYFCRRQRKNRSMAIESHLANEYRCLQDFHQNGYVWRNDYFFKPTFYNVMTSPSRNITTPQPPMPMHFNRRPRKRVNSYQVRRMLAENITHKSTVVIN